MRETEAGTHAHTAGQGVVGVFPDGRILGRPFSSVGSSSPSGSWIGGENLNDNGPLQSTELPPEDGGELKH